MSGSSVEGLPTPDYVPTKMIDAVAPHKYRRAQIVTAAQADGDPALCARLLEMLGIDDPPREAS
jgi:hypothetical protein